jgi:integrase
LLPRSQKIKKVEHHPAIPYTQINEFVLTLRKEGGSAPLALEFMLLTAARTGEVVAAKWDEVDFDSMVWTVPAERMKSGKEHRVPLSEVAPLNRTHYCSVKGERDESKTRGVRA